MRPAPAPGKMGAPYPETVGSFRAGGRTPEQIAKELAVKAVGDRAQSRWSEIGFAKAVARIAGASAEVCWADEQKL